MRFEQLDDQLERGGSASSGSGNANRSSRFTALRNCLKQHGVTLPTRRPGGGPPGGAGGSGAPGAGGGPPGGGFFGGGGAGAGGRLRQQPEAPAALKACGGGNFRGGRRFRLSQHER